MFKNIGAKNYNTPPEYIDKNNKRKSEIELRDKKKWEDFKTFTEKEEKKFIMKTLFGNIYSNII